MPRSRIAALRQKTVQVPATSVLMPSRLVTRTVVVQLAKELGAFHKLRNDDVSP